MAAELGNEQFPMAKTLGIGMTRSRTTRRKAMTSDVPTPMIISLRLLTNTLLWRSWLTAEEIYSVAP